MLTIGEFGPRTRRWMAAAVACASAATSGCSPRAAAERVPPPPVVSVVEARRMTVPIMAEPIGTTRALQEVSIRARVRGFLKEILMVMPAVVVMAAFKASGAGSSETLWLPCAWRI